ncbi:TrkH family potassium uptake protein [bacterium]|nr:TrkH family potassium uptake protein [bacterium]
MNIRLLCRYLGILLGFLTLLEVLIVPFAIYYNEWHALGRIAEAMAGGFLFAVILYLIGRDATGDVFRREALAIVGLGWILAAGVAALPLFLTGVAPTYTDAYFESMSGLTTTGSTILTTIEDHPKSILLWRSFLHFLGGLGIIVLFVAILPMLGVGGRALFKQEVPGPVPEGLTPRIKDTAVALWKIYIAFNVIEAIALMILGMSFYDAINHAMATMATGGFSTKNTSVLAFASPMIEWCIIIFMVIAGTNFSLHLRAVQGRFDYFRDPEFLSYISIIIGSAVVIAVLLYVHETPAVSKPGSFNFRDAFFTVVALKTTTGFGTVDFQQWPNAARIMLLILMFFGGCAGSTGGGLKVIRWIILFKAGYHEIQSKISPRRVRRLKLGGRPIGDDIVREVLAFFFLYMGIAILGSVAIAFAMPHQSVLTSISSVVATLNNIGPGLDAIGPTANFAHQSLPAKWLLSLFMVLGRLELFAILVLFSRNFWRVK